MHDKLFLNVLNIKVQSSSCGRPQAQARFEAVSKPKLVSVGLSQRKRVVIPSKAKNKLFPSASCVFCDTESVMKLPEQYDGHTFCHSWKMPKIGTKKNGIDALGRSTDKPRKEYCGERTVTIRALQGHSHGVAINPNTHSTRTALSTTTQFQRKVNGQEG